MNYHAGIATRSSNHNVETLHLGVKCCGDDDNAEIVARILLLCACKYPDKDLGKVCVNLGNSLVELQNVLKGNFQLIDSVITASSTSDFGKHKLIMFGCIAIVTHLG